MSKNPDPTTYQPRLALQIGVTGHRDLGLDAAAKMALQASVTKLLQTIAEVYQQLTTTKTTSQLLSQQAPLPPRLLSPLAAGADSLVAQAALANQYELHSPLPFPREVYALDFHDEALATFNELYGKAQRVLALDGVRERKEEAYREVGHFVLRHSDIVVALWDGVEKLGSPGTSGMVTAALRLEKPIIWIRPYAPELIEYHDPRKKKPVWQTCDQDKLADLLRWLLLPPEQTKEDKEEAEEEKSEFLTFGQKFFHIQTHCCLAYLHHRQPKRNLLGTVYRTLFSLVGKHSPKDMIGNPYQQDADYQWQTIVNAATPALPVNADTKNHFVRADSLASFYADKYRGTFVMAFTLGGFAVFWALLGAPFMLYGKESEFFAALEFVTISSIAVLVLKGRLLNYHQRWIDFRLLAERLRQYAFLTPIGGVSQLSQPVFHRHGDYSYALIDWWVRTISRAEGIPADSFNTDYRKAYHAFLIAMIEDQAGYHKNNHQRNHRIAHTLHTCNGILLVAIVTACGIHFFWHEHVVAVWSTIVAAVLPAFGAAVAGVLSQGEFERIAKRSKGMAIHLESIKKELTASPDAAVLELMLQAQNIIDTMSQELYDWRVIFRAKPLVQHA
ncbi:MAG: hypothetical protein PHR16_03445 [Methylovulum sp.]|nr:hypothetical protein [Methylovulum sp.]